MRIVVLLSALSVSLPALTSPAPVPAVTQLPPAPGQAPPGAAAGPSEADELWKAARSGDTTTVKRLLDAGLDANTPFRYGATALSYACDRGHLEVVKVLLAHGADVNVKDTFYGATPLDWATNPASGGVTMRHVEIVRLLLRHGAEGGAAALTGAAESGQTDLVKAILDAGKVDDEAMTDALTAAQVAKHDEAASLLRTAGARPLPDATLVVDPATLALFAGTYQAGEDRRVEFSVADGTLRIHMPGEPKPVPLGAIDRTTFRSTESPLIIAVFEVIDGIATAATVRTGGERYTLKRTTGDRR
jgi:hypothetical protein